MFHLVGHMAQGGSDVIGGGSYFILEVVLSLGVSDNDRPHLSDVGIIKESFDGSFGIDVKGLLVDIELLRF